MFSISKTNQNHLTELSGLIFILLKNRLSELFIEKFKDKVNWNLISRYQKLSPEFVVNHIDKIEQTIVYNPCYKLYPDSIKLLLNQKFNK